MKIQIRLFRDTATDSAGGLFGTLSKAVNPITAGLGALQFGIGIVQDIKAKKKIDNLLNQQQAYKTPQEVYDILNATKSNAQQGYDSTTLNFLTNETDQAFSSGIDASLKLGGDPNDLSALFGQKINAIMKIGAENHQLNTQNFSQYLSALGTVAENKAAEFKSKQDIIKNKLQAAGAQMGSATGNVSGGINTILAALSADAQGNLYNTDGTPKVKPTQTVATNGAYSSYERGYMV